MLCLWLTFESLYKQSQRAWEIVQERDNAGVGDYLTLDHCEHGSTPPYERVPSSATNPIGCHVLAVYPDRSDLLGGKDVVPLRCARTLTSSCKLRDSTIAWVLS